MKSLIFDQSGTYLALGGTDVQIYICKQWTEILHFTGIGCDWCMEAGKAKMGC